MAKAAAGPGIYSPWNWRARRLIAQLRRATHRTVQNAIIQELIHELERGSRRARKAGGHAATAGSWVSAQVRAALMRALKKGAAAVRRQAADLSHAARYGARLTCAHPQCKGQEFRNRLQFKAHARSHQRGAAPQGRRYPPGDPRSRTAARTPAARARQHAADHISAAGPQGRAAQAAARNATAAGRPLGAKDLKAMAKGVTAARNAPPSPARGAGGADRGGPFRRPGDPRIMGIDITEARHIPHTPENRAAMRASAISRRELNRAHRALRAAATPAERAAASQRIRAVRDAARKAPRLPVTPQGGPAVYIQRPPGRVPPGVRTAAPARPARTARASAAPRPAPARTAPAAAARPGRG